MRTVTPGSGSFFSLTILPASLPVVPAFATGAIAQSTTAVVRRILRQVRYMWRLLSGASRARLLLGHIQSDERGNCGNKARGCSKSRYKTPRGDAAPAPRGDAVHWRLPSFWDHEPPEKLGRSAETVNRIRGPRHPEWPQFRATGAGPEADQNEAGAPSGAPARTSAAVRN